MANVQDLFFQGEYVMAIFACGEGALCKFVSCVYDGSFIVDTGKNKIDLRQVPNGEACVYDGSFVAATSKNKVDLRQALRVEKTPQPCINVGDTILVRDQNDGSWSVAVLIGWIAEKTARPVPGVYALALLGYDERGDSIAQTFMQHKELPKHEHE